MKKNWLVAVILASVLAIVGLVGCQSDAISTPDNGEQEIEIRPAPIHKVQVYFALSYPPQVIIYIKGGLIDSCTELYAVSVAPRVGNTINIEVKTKRPKDAACAQVYGYFEENVNLGSDFTAGETYTINVNDETTTFVME